MPTESSPAAAGAELIGEDRLHRLLLRSVVDYAIYMLDTEGRVISWNPGAEAIKGYAAEEIIGQHFSRFFTEEDRDAGLPGRAIRTAAERGRFEHEGWRVRKDGSRFWAMAVLDAVHDENGRLIGFAKITRDMTERRTAELALRESERQFRTLVRGVSDYALYMLDPDGVVTNWNTGAENIKGYLAEEVAGKHFSIFYTQEDRDAGLPGIALQTARATGRFEIEGWRVRKDGERFWANAVIDAIRDDAGELIGFAKITRDITERLENQRRLEEAREQLFQSQKMEAIGQLTGGVAHDFNNLLTVILGGVDLARRRIDDPQRVDALLANVTDAAQRAAALTRQLLAFARRQALAPEVISLGEMLPGFVDLLRRSLGGNIQTALDIDGGLMLMADLRQLELALLNVCLNARDAMPDNGLITVEARRRRIDDAGRDLHGDFIALTVIDTGMGMSAEVRARAFEPFFTTKELGRGTGLGLSQAYGFAQQSGGFVELESEPGKGARVTFVLPAAQAGQTAADKAAPPADANLNGRSILVVEDDPAVAQLACSLLTEAGAAVRYVADAETALHRLQAERFDLVFSDILMPGRNGLELAREVRRSWPTTPVLLATGYAGPAVCGESEFHILAKPYDRQALTRAVAEELARAP